MTPRTTKSVILSAVLAALWFAGVLAGGSHVSAAGGSGDQKSIDLLEKIRVEPEYRGKYNRDLFPHWNRSSSGCSVREVVLRDEARANFSTSGRYCTVRSGEWLSVYDGKVLTNPALIEIDHVVALSEAWDSGAWKWDAKTREQFANDLTSPITLRAVSAVSNQAKSDKDPAEWLPMKSNQCAYAADWVAIKARWKLSVDPAERLALRLLLGRC